MAAFIPLYILAASAVGGAVLYTRRILPRSVRNYNNQYTNTRKQGMLQSSTRAQYAVWSPDANLPLNQPTQRAKPGNVTKVIQGYAEDVVNMQQEQISYNFRPRTGKIVLESAGYTPMLTQTLNANKTLDVLNGDISGDPMTTSRKERMNERFVYSPNTTFNTGWASETDTTPQAAYVDDSVYVDRRNPWAPGGYYVNLTSPNDDPITRSGLVPKVSYIDPAAEGEVYRSIGVAV